MPLFFDGVIELLRTLPLLHEFHRRNTKCENVGKEDRDKHPFPGLHRRDM